MESGNKLKVLAIDDEPLNLDIIEEILEERFEIAQANDGAEGIMTAGHFKPDLILLDVNMPVMDGLETCRRLKADAETSHIPVVFLSALSRVEERMAGYAAGADDYISKPFDEQELLVKIELALSSKTTKDELEKSSNDAMSMAMTAMSTAGEVGAVLQFTRKSFQCDNYSSLAKQLLETCDQYGLKASLRMRSGNEELFFSGEPEVSSLEQKVLNQHDQGRFVDFGKRTVVHYKYISLLIKNMPVEDADKYGRMKDNIGLLAEAADARIEGLMMNLKLQEREEMLGKLLNTTREILNDVDQEYRSNGKKNEGIMSNLVQRVESSFMHLGLSDEQEQALLGILSGAEKESIALYDSGLDLEKRIEFLVNELNGVSQSQVEVAVKEKAEAIPC
ncbi:MAG: response regulator [Gammaproteobacteria bacterium]|nr:response regulator [Gammaproteobacteria bacterium]